MTGTAAPSRVLPRAAGAPDRLGLGLLAAGAAGTALYAVSTFGPGRPRFDTALDHLLYDTVVVVLAVSFLIRIRALRRERAAWALIAASFVATALAVVLYSLSGGDQTTPELTFADLVRIPAAMLYLGGFFLLAHRRTGGVGVAARMDGSAAALATAGLAACILPAILDAPGGGAVAAAVLVTLELIGVAVAVAVVAAYSRAAGGAVLLLGLASVCFLGADLNYAGLVLRDRWEDGGPIDALWLLAWVLTALAAWYSDDAPRPPRPSAARDLLTPFAVGAGAFLVIVAGAVLATPAAALLGGSALALMGLRLGRTIDQRTADLSQALDASERDPLTGIANRRALQQAIDAHPAMAAILVDLDGFKALNDTHGHVAGDAALREIAHVLAEHVRPGDLVGRWGGDEFMVLARLDAAGLPAFGARLQEALDAAAIEVAGAPVPVTGSVGAAAPGPDLVVRADRALYAAKAERRR